MHLICAVPGSGKTWICKQLDQFSYIPHDEYPVDRYHVKLIEAAQWSKKPILAEAPFRCSVLIEQLKEKEISVKTYHIDEPLVRVIDQYEKRMKKRFPKQHMSNYYRYRDREWDHRGTSEQILSILKAVPGE